MQMNLILYLMLVKSKFLVCIPGELRSMFNNLNLNGSFCYIGGRAIDNVTFYSHIIMS